jgi:hypothetical protein
VERKLFITNPVPTLEKFRFPFRIQIRVLIQTTLGKIKKKLVQNLAFLILVAVRCHLISRFLAFLPFVIPFYVGSGYKSGSATGTATAISPVPAVPVR